MLSVFRLSTLPLTLTPFMIGVISAPIVGSWNFGFLVMGLAGTVALHLAANTANEWFDYLSGVDQLAVELADNTITAPGILISNRASVGQLQSLTLLLLAVAGVCGLILSLRLGPLVGAIFLLGGVLSYFYTAPPLSLSYRGRGLGEVSALMGAGFLPVSVGYITQVGYLAWQPLALVTPLAFLAAGLLLAHEFLHWNADKIAGKFTPVVAFGRGNAGLLLGGLLVAGYSSLIINIIIGLLPMGVVVLFLTIIPVGHAWTRARVLTSVDSYFTLVQFISQAHFGIALATIIALMLAR